MTEKLENLKNYIKSLNSVAVAFSSGVDSAFLLKIAHEVLLDNVIAITVKSCLFPNRELNEAVEFCKKEGIKHIIIEADELNIEGFKQNPPNRCYLCKKELFEKIIKISKANNIENVVEGSNIDDDGDYRPGYKAVQELGVKSPLKYAELNKEEIRKFSRQYGLHTADKPSFACLASRFAYGESITEEKLNMIDKAEQLLFELGFYQFRVRIHGNIARIEVMPDEFDKVLKYRQQITEKFKIYGFTYVTMDLQGYRTGSMNDTLK